jgi:hypothetical protein
LGDDSKISISIKRWALDITLKIATGHYHGASGLCFGNRNAIPADKNMLDGNLAIPDFKSMKRGRKCFATTKCIPDQGYTPIIPSGCTQVKDAATYDRNTVIPRTDTAFTPIPYEEALAHCKEVIGTPNILKSICDFYISSCATDLAQTGYLDIAEMTRSSFNTVVQMKIEGEKDSFDPSVREVAAHKEQTLGFGDNPCVNDCGGGTCTPNGCVCNSGFGGDQCAIDLGYSGPVSLGQYGESADKVHVNGSSLEIENDDGLDDLAVKSSATSRGVFSVGFCGILLLFL